MVRILKSATVKNRRPEEWWVVPILRLLIGASFARVRSGLTPGPFCKKNARNCVFLGFIIIATSGIAVGEPQPLGKEEAIPMAPLTLANSICAKDALCEDIIVQSANINLDGIEDYVVYLIGNEECGMQNCPLLFLLSDSASYDVVNPEISAEPNSIRWIDEEPTDGKRKFYFESSSSDCPPIWKWAGNKPAVIPTTKDQKPSSTGVCHNE